MVLIISLLCWVAYMEPECDASAQSLDSPAVSDNLEQALTRHLQKMRHSFLNTLVMTSYMMNLLCYILQLSTRPHLHRGVSSLVHLQNQIMWLSRECRWMRLLSICGSDRNVCHLCNFHGSGMQLLRFLGMRSKTFATSQIGCDIALSSSTSSAKCESPDSLPGSEFARKRLKVSAMIRSDDQVRWEALRKFKVLLTINPANSFLGSTLADKATLLKSENEISASFCDAFADKKTGTLSKRASSCWRFIQWVIKQGFDDPLSVGEAVFCSYMGHLRETGAPTTANCFLQSWTFLFSCCWPEDSTIGHGFVPSCKPSLWLWKWSMVSKKWPYPHLTITGRSAWARWNYDCCTSPNLTETCPCPRHVGWDPCACWDAAWGYTLWHSLRVQWHSCQLGRCHMVAMSGAWILAIFQATGVGTY